MSLVLKADDRALIDAAKKEGREEGYQDGLSAGIEAGKGQMLSELIAAAPWPHKGWLKAYVERRGNAKRQY